MDELADLQDRLREIRQRKKQAKELDESGVFFGEDKAAGSLRRAWEEEEEKIQQRIYDLVGEDGDDDWF